MKLFSLFDNRDRNVIKRLKNLMHIAIKHGKTSLIDVPDMIDNKVKVTKILGNSLLDNESYNWLIPHWISALSSCYKIKDSTKEYLKIISKSEQDLIRVLEKYKDRNELNHLLNMQVKYERYEIAAQIRDILKK